MVHRFTSHKLTRRRASVGALLVLHFGWLSIGAMPVSMAAVASAAPAAVSIELAPCHGDHLAATSSIVDDASVVRLEHGGIGGHAHSPCCNTQGHCVGGCFAFVAPTEMATRIPVSHAQSPQFRLTAPAAALLDFELRPPIAL